MFYTFWAAMGARLTLILPNVFSFFHNFSMGIEKTEFDADFLLIKVVKNYGT
jgi:hypothetical protein